MSRALTDELTRMSKRGTSLRNNKQLGADLQGVVYWRLRILSWPSIHVLVLDLTWGFLVLQPSPLLFRLLIIVDIGVDEKSRH
jgi:hypothetical protein